MKCRVDDVIKTPERKAARRRLFKFKLRE